MKTTAKLICAAALLSAATAPAFAAMGGAQGNAVGNNMIMTMMSDGTTATMPMPTDKMMMHKMMMGAHKMKGCLVLMNTGNRGTYYMMVTDKQCAAMGKG